MHSLVLEKRQILDPERSLSHLSVGQVAGQSSSLASTLYLSYNRNKISPPSTDV